MSEFDEENPFLSLSKDESEVQTCRAKKSRRCRADYYAFAYVLLATSFFWILLFVGFMPSINDSSMTNGTNPLRTTSTEHNATTNRILLDCGESREEAIAKHCKYDFAIGGWLPNPCIDEDSIEDYLKDGSATGFADVNLTQPLDLQEMLQRGFYWSSFRDHINHCLTGFKRQSKAIFEDRPALDATMINQGHTAHCAKLLMDTALGIQKPLPTQNTVGYFTCWIRR